MTGLCLLSGSVLADPIPRDDSPPLTVGEIRIRTRDIFAPDEVERADLPVRWMRRAMNRLHVNTRHFVLRRELLFDEGEPFRPGLLAETERNLRSLGFLNDIRVAATDTAADGRVGILVSVRESWSLRTAANYSRASGGEQRWNLQFSDRNVLGYGATMGLGLGEDETATFWNLWLSKRRLLATDFILDLEYWQPANGRGRTVTLYRPFYATGGTWGLDVRAWDTLAARRLFVSNASPVGSDPATGGSLYARVPQRRKGVEIGFLRRVWGESTGRVWRLGAGLRVDESLFELGNQPYWELSDDRWVSLDFLLEPGQTLTRSQGTFVFPHLRLQTLGRRWTKARFVRNYGPVEDIPLDWFALVRVGPGGRNVGSTTDVGESCVLAEVQATRWTRLARGFFSLEATAVARSGTGAADYHRFEILAGWTRTLGPDLEPWLTRIFAEYGRGRNLPGDGALILGLDRGIRTLDFDGMAGDHLVRWNVEQGKVSSHELLGLFRIGAAAFYDGGCAWWADEERDLSDARHEVGIGLRLGPTRSARSAVTRLDLSWDLAGGGPVFTAVTRGRF